jgi:pilus assembly protein Flp/PilA
MLKGFIRDEGGATAIEYGMIAAFIAIGLITVLQSVGNEIKPIFEDVEAGLKKRPA